ncbi:WYL domain-containing protein [Fusobacterium polymorphum]|uniref:WYL domain-containing protein n=1 Tax=Fusobacterium nucleatum subsp. polymorphum TaxID=76857 RepID=UPI000BFB36C0|nr:WYL domain-containing protein [Fusobacterium polymorphum]PHI04933.1 WYL domain-containing protein [Fusobacterium polymorphum]
MKKVRFTISDFMNEIIKSDSEYFKLQIGKIGNIIFNYYIDKNLNKVELEDSSGEVIQFNLNKSNEEIFMDTLIRNKIETEAEYWRNIFFTYINNLRYKREEILFEKNFKNIEKALKDGNKIKIKYHNYIRLINPYFIKVSDSESRSYLFCYCEKNQDYRNYRVSEIGEIWFTNEKIEIKDKKYIDEVYKNFDPFLYKNRVKVKFTEKGLELYEKVLNNRPRLLNKDNNIYTFECDNKLAMIYFAQFFSLIEILEPQELREKLQNELENTLKIYKNREDKDV